MRSKEQFKAYVYEKAEFAGRKQRQNRIAVMRSIAAFSLCLIVAAICIYVSARNNLLTPKAESDLMQMRAYDEIAECAVADGIDAASVYGATSEFFLYSASSGTGMPKDDSAKNSACELEYSLVVYDDCVALLFDKCVATAHTVEYFTDEIVVKIALAENRTENEDATYTVPLEKAQYNGQKITVLYE